MIKISKMSNQEINHHYQTKEKEKMNNPKSSKINLKLLRKFKSNWEKGKME